MITKITPSLEAIRKAVLVNWSGQWRRGELIDLGVYVRRRIAGSPTWSQHAWGNAFDIGGKTFVLDQVHTWLLHQKRTEALPIGLILWRVKNHYDHIHVEGLPKMTGTPPISTTTTSQEDEAVIKDIQGGLKRAGFDPGIIDGKWGPKTAAAFALMCTAAARPSAATYLTETVKATVDELRRRLEA